MPNRIFQEPPEDIDGTWTHGALLGGMVGYDDESLARSYFLAGRVLAEHVLSTGDRGQELICPILYVCRHGIELYLKVILHPAKVNYSLGSLLDALCRHVRDRYDEKVPEWVTCPITELAQFDPGSDLFRYGQTRPPDSTHRLIQGGEHWVDLRVVKRTMLELEYAFMRVLVADTHGLDALNAIVPRPGLLC